MLRSLFARQPASIRASAEVMWKYTQSSHTGTQGSSRVRCLERTRHEGGENCNVPASPAARSNFYRLHGPPRCIVLAFEAVARSLAQIDSVFKMRRAVLQQSHCAKMNARSRILIGFVSTVNRRAPESLAHETGTSISLIGRHSLADIGPLASGTNFDKRCSGAEI